MRYKKNERKKEENKNKTDHRNGLKYYVVWILTIIILVGMFIGYVKVEQRVQQYQATIDELNTEIKELKKNNKYLEQQMENVNSEEYIERIARERLGMVKKGEVVLKQTDSDSDNNSSSKDEKNK